MGGKMNLLNNYTLPIIAVTIIMTIIALFAPQLVGFGIITGLVLSFIIFYYFGKNHDGWLYTGSLFLLALAWDLVQAPYAVDFNGVISSQALLSSASIDFFVASILSGFGVSGIVLFYLTYVGGFALLFSLAIVLTKMSKKD
jgi:hypothetical protein